MSSQPSLPMAGRSLNATMGAVCDVCGKCRTGTSKVSHAKCSKIRQQRGFKA